MGLVPEDLPPVWSTMVGSADFPMYVVDRPVLDDVRQGGFGFDQWPDATLTRVTAVGSFAGSDVAVVSMRPGGRPEVRARLEVAHSLVMAAAQELAVPYTVSVVKEDRDIDIDGQPVRFSGARAVGKPGWVGWAELSGGAGVVVVVSGEVGVLVESLRTSTPRELSLLAPTKHQPSAQTATADAREDSGT